MKDLKTANASRTRGGARSGAGRRFKFNGMTTVVVRIPAEFKEQILEYASELANQADDIELFTRSYQEHGREYVPIHWLRDQLNLPGDRFNDILNQLYNDDTIILQGGDPSTMSQDQIEKSYIQAGNLRIAVSWVKSEKKDR